MKNLFIFLSVAGLLTMASCNDSGENTPTPEFEVAPLTIPAQDVGGDYEISVTGNVGWTASVKGSAEWCTIAPASGKGNGTITVTLAENIATEPRNATITVTPDSESGFTAKEVALTQAGITAPEYAISEKIWTLGEGETLQMWSDAILLPRCNKTEFNGGNADAPLSDCRSSKNEEVSLFSAIFVQENHEEICADGWRVPLFEDFQMLDINLGGIGEDNQFADETTGMIADPVAVYDSELWGGKCYGGIYHPESIMPGINDDGFVYEKGHFYRGLRVVDAQGIPVEHGDAVLDYSDGMIDFDFGGVHSVGYGIPLRCIKTL